MTGKRAVVLGAGGGIGAALVAGLRADPAYAEVIACARGADNADLRFDLADEASIAALAGRIGASGPLDLVLVATGMLHEPGGAQPEKSLRAIDPMAMQRSFALNTIGPALMAKHFLPLLPRDRRAVFAALSARVGSIGDNQLGGWYSYRASKAALNMLLRCFAIELARTHPAAIAVALHPGTVASRLSEPFARGGPGRKIMTTAASAAHLLRVIDGLGPADSGHLFAWDGAKLPF